MPQNHSSSLSTIANMPVLRRNRLAPEGHETGVKAESFNPGGLFRTVDLDGPEYGDPRLVARMPPVTTISAHFFQDGCVPAVRRVGLKLASCKPNF